MANTFKNNVLRVDTDGVVYTGKAHIIGAIMKTAGVLGSFTIRDGGAGGAIMLEFGGVAANTTDGVTGIEIFVSADIHVAKTNPADIVFLYLR